MSMHISTLHAIDNRPQCANRLAGFAVAALTVGALLLGGCANVSEMQKDRTTGTGTGTGTGTAAGEGAGEGAGADAARSAGVHRSVDYILSSNLEKKAGMGRAAASTGVATQMADKPRRLDIPSDAFSFDTGRANIRPALRPILDQFVNGLRKQPDTEILIVGHTDATGSDAINDPLSLRRAANARRYLISRGVDGQRIQIDGRGSHQPVADNSSVAGRARNRRVELIVEPVKLRQAAQAVSAARGNCAEGQGMNVIYPSPSSLRSKWIGATVSDGECGRPK